MREAVRGYAAALSEEAEAAGQLRRHAEELAGFAEAVAASQPLAEALADGGLEAPLRAQVAEDLLADQALAATVRVVRYAVEAERPAELLDTLRELGERAGRLLAEGAGPGAAAPGPGGVGQAQPPRMPPGAQPPVVRSGAADAVAVDPPVGSHGQAGRVQGYASAVFETIGARDELDDVEDALFRLARLVESNEDLASTLGDPHLPASLRCGVVEDLLSGRVGASAVRLASFVVAGARRRDLLALLDRVVELAALERGRRVADVRVAGALEPAQEERLRSALSARVRRDVELRVRRDDSLLGGMVVLVGDLLFDGSVRHRLDAVRALLEESTGAVQQTTALPADGVGSGGAQERGLNG